MSQKNVEDFLKKTGHKKKVSKFEKYKEDILHLCKESASLEIITQYLETKGIKRTKGYTALSSYIRHHLSDQLIKKDNAFPPETTSSSSIVPRNNRNENDSAVATEHNKSRRHVSSPSTREKRMNYSVSKEKD